MRSDPGVGTFDFDRWKPGINSEAVTKSVPRGFLKVTLLENGMKRGVNRGMQIRRSVMIY